MANTKPDITSDQTAQQAGDKPSGSHENKFDLNLESVSKLFTISVATIYLFGFLVVMRHLSRYGVSSLTVLKLQYLVAGLWLVMPIVLFTVLYSSTEAINLLRPRTTLGRHIVGYALLKSVAGLVLLILASFIISEFGFESVFRQGWKILLAFFGFYLAIETLVWLNWTCWKRTRGTEASDIPWWLDRNLRIFYATLLGLVSLSYLSYFAVHVYPLIPYSLGGGKPLTAIFLLKAQEKDSLPVIRDGCTSRSVPYKLLLTTDRTFVVLSPDEQGQSIEFNRDAVAGMVVLKDSEAKSQENKTPPEHK